MFGCLDNHSRRSKWGKKPGAIWGQSGPCHFWRLCLHLLICVVCLLYILGLFIFLVACLLVDYLIVCWYTVILVLKYLVGEVYGGLVVVLKAWESPFREGPTSRYTVSPFSQTLVKTTAWHTIFLNMCQRVHFHSTLWRTWCNIYFNILWEYFTCNSKNMEVVYAQFQHICCIFFSSNAIKFKSFKGSNSPQNSLSARYATQ